MKKILLITSLLLAITPLIAEEGDWSSPISKLPPNVKYEEGQFSLFADYREIEGKSAVLLFLINDSAEEVVLPSQDGDVYIKQEAKVAGKWTRSQPHRYSWCGNSYYPAPPIPAKHFVAYPPQYPGWVPPVELTETEKSTGSIRQVRYRFYGEKFKDVASNEGEMPVADALIKMAATDSMALPSAPLETLASIATGKLIVEPLDHTDPRNQSISLLRNYPGTKQAQASISDVISGTLVATDADDEQLLRYARLRATAIDVVSEVFDSKRAWDIYFGLVVKERDRDALDCLIERFEGRTAEQLHVLDEILSDYEHPLWSRALKWRVGFWKEDIRRQMLKNVLHDEAVPAHLRNDAKSLYYSLYRNPKVMVWSRYSFDTGLTRIEIENISSEPIELTYTHLYDLIHSQVEIGYGGEELSYRKDFSDVVDAERHSPLTKSLDHEERLAFEEVNIWRYHQIPDELPEDFAYRVISNLPQFGDVPAGVGSTSFFDTTKPLHRDILQRAREEQSGNTVPQGTKREAEQAHGE